MRDNYISKWELLYYWLLTGMNQIKRFFKHFSKKGREELAYEQLRFHQIREKIRNYNRKE